MRDYVIINGVNSLTIKGLAISKLPPITKPMIRTQREEIDGRDGDLITELGYSAYDKELEIGLYGNFEIDDIIKYFTGEGTIVFSNESDKYYYFKIIEQIDYEALLKFKTATVTLHCQPFKYPLEEEPIEIAPTTIEDGGETISFDDTYEGSLKIIDLKGNTYQDSTTGKNLMPLNISSFPKTSSNGNLTATLDDKNVIHITGTKSASGWETISGLMPTGTSIIFEAGKTYTIPTNIVCGVSKVSDSSWVGNKSGTITPDEDWKATSTYWQTNATGNVNIYVYPMIIQGTGTIDANTYEPYTNGASPNPDYPQDIHTVSGDNTIEVVGKNLFDKDSGFRLGYINASGSFVSSNTVALFNQYITCKPNTTYTLSFSKTIYNTASPLFYDANKTFLSRATSLNNLTSRTITTPENCYYMVIQFNYDNSSIMTQEIIDSVNCQLEKGSSATTYEPYQSQSYPINLGEYELCKIGDYQDKIFKNTTNSPYYDSTLDLNEWYLKKEIGKVVLDGTENWIYNQNGFYQVNYTLAKTGIEAYSNYYKFYLNVNTAEKYGFQFTSNYVRIKNTDQATANDFKTWLSTHNTTVYYVLSTPTYTKITGELKEQLEALEGARSYDGQTNIGQENDDLSFFLNALISYLEPMEINNIGNIYAKPILTIEGSGNIEVVLNDIQILEIDLGDGGKIAIDVPNLEAFNPDDNTLLNRYVTGDYMKLLIQEGENTLSFNGDVSKATLTNYIRYI